MKRLFSMLTIAVLLMVGLVSCMSSAGGGDNFKLYETANMWTFLKLDTRTGQIWQVQYSVEGDEYRFESVLNGVDLTDGMGYEPNRFELYRTENIRNFVLLDKVEGRAWQVQWGKEEQRIVVNIN